MARPRTAVQEPPSASNGVGEWQRRRFAKATLPTGQEVTLRAVTLDELAALDALPDDLVAVAWYEKLPGGISAQIPAPELQTPEGAARARKLSQDTLALRDKLVLAAVVEPAITETDLPSLDPFDKDMVANLASRQDDLDATGRRVWGVEPLNTFQDFRDVHGCDAGPEPCPGCAELVQRYSQVQ